LAEIVFAKFMDFTRNNNAPYDDDDDEYYTETTTLDCLHVCNLIYIISSLHNALIVIIYQTEINAKQFLFRVVV
jgi:hypothetical protein